jgi:hypothetical protein
LATTTTRLELTKPAGTENVSRKIINDNYDKIDAAVATLTGDETLTNKDLSSDTNVFPSTLVTLNGVETLTNKDLSSDTNVFPSTLVTLNGVETLANKRITPRITSITSASSVTPNSNSTDMVVITAQAEPLTINDPSGTPTNGQKIIIRIKDNGTAQSLSFGSGYRAVGVTMPITTVINKTTYLGMMYNSVDLKWDVIALAQEV